MKEAILSVRNSEGHDKKVKVKLTKDYFILSDISQFSHSSPIESTAIESPAQISPFKPSFLNQVSRQ